MERLIVEELRGDVIEAVHNVSAVVLQGKNIIMSFGDTERVVPMRSVAKPFMLGPLIKECGNSRIRLTSAMLSIMASSHNGEKAHRDLVERILELSESTVADLFCGSHLPYYDWLYNDYFEEKNLARRQLFHNCSGKHAGMLLLSKLIGVDKTNYWSKDCPVQTAITDSVIELLSVGKKYSFSLALDGCGVPTYCATLPIIAQAYQALYSVEHLKTVFDAIIQEPFYNSGTDRVEKVIIEECGCLAKSGSSGLFCIADSEEDIGIAIKVNDGSDDAAEVAIVEILSMLGMLGQEQSKRLNQYRYLPILTSTAENSGRFNPVWMK